jgi:hypothetical protein
MARFPRSISSCTFRIKCARSLLLAQEKGRIGVCSGFVVQEYEGFAIFGIR